MATEQLIEHLNGIARLSAGFIDETVRILKQEHYKNHQIIQAQGQPETRFWFLKKGFARNYFYGEDGEEHTTRFWHANEIIFSHTGFWNFAAMEYIEILEDAELNSISYEQLHQLITKFPETNVIIKYVVLNALKERYRQHSLCSLPAEKRYQQLRKDSPEVFKKAPLRIIASYLNMNRVSLSRIISKEH